MKHSKISHLKAWVRGHKTLGVLIALAVIFVIYKIVATATSGATAPRMIYAMVSRGDLSVSITGSGQVSAKNQIDLKGKASADITDIYVKAGQTVKSGTLIARLDSKDAGISLESAKITYEKLVKPADPEDIKKAEDDLLKSYNDGWNEVSAVFVDHPGIISGMDLVFYSQTGYLGEARNTQRSQIARQYVQRAGLSFDQAKKDYVVALNEYNSLSRLSATSSLRLLIDHTAMMEKVMAEALKNTQNAISYIMQSERDATTAANAAASDVNSWLATANSHLSTMITYQNAITANEIALRDLVKGPDPLDIRSGQLSLQQSRNAYEDYFVRAPFDGIIARVSAKVGDAGNSSIATLIADKKVSEISMNEVDVAKIKIGQKAVLTFDAVEGLALHGQVDEVDLIGTVSQGVVTYNVKVAFETDDSRVKSGMSVSAEIIVDSRQGVLMIPNSAVKAVNGRRYVETASGPMNIEIGISNDTHTEVISGLSEGDSVIARTVASNGGAASQAPSIFNAARPRTTTGAAGGAAQIRINR